MRVNPISNQYNNQTVNNRSSFGSVAYKNPKTFFKNILDLKPSNHFVDEFAYMITRITDLSTGRSITADSRLEAINPTKKMVSVIFEEMRNGKPSICEAAFSSKATPTDVKNFLIKIKGWMTPN